VGCKLNQAETESLARKFFHSGFQVVNPHEAADIYLLNTCTVTRIADHKCRKLLRLAHRRNPGALIVVTGCYVERVPSELSSIDGIELLIGNRDKEKIVDIVRNRIIGHNNAVQRNGTGELPHRTRSMVRIQEGCSQPCSFCIVPRVRGPEKSRPEEEVISDIQARVTEGYKEVVLTGTRIGRYGRGNGLPKLIARILLESDIPRIRLSSLEPSDLTPGLLRLWNNSRLCPHIHVPLQSGSDSVLERMGRPYNTTEYEQAIAMAREVIQGNSNGQRGDTEPVIDHRYNGGLS
jgi:threonylcarbamoyladenosine tRNA methylthiotransferase MtaB